MNKLVVLNHKMSLLYDDLYSYIEMINNIETDCDIVVCPSNIYLEAFLNNSDYAIGCQNINYNLDVNNTGEISTDQIRALGVEYAIIGHNERVEKYHENKSIVNQCDIFRDVEYIEYVKENKVDEKSNEVVN